MHEGLDMQNYLIHVCSEVVHWSIVHISKLP